MRVHAIAFHQIQDDATFVGQEEMTAETREQGLGPVQELGQSGVVSDRSIGIRAESQNPNQAPTATKDFDMTRS